MTTEKLSTDANIHGLFPLLISAALGEFEAYQICMFVIQVYICILHPITHKIFYNQYCLTFFLLQISCSVHDFLEC